MAKCLQTFCVLKFPVKIHGFQVESPNVTNNSLICKDDIQGKNHKYIRCGKINVNKFVFL